VPFSAAGYGDGSKGAGEDGAGVDPSTKSTVQPEGCLDEATPQDWRISRDTRATADILT